MTVAHENVSEFSFVDPSGKLFEVAVTPQWEVIAGKEPEIQRLSAASALVVCALGTRINQLLTIEDIDETMEACNLRAIQLGGEPNPVYGVGNYKTRRYTSLESVRRSPKSIMRYNLLQVGDSGKSRRFFFCANVVNPDYGLRHIEDQFTGDEQDLKDYYSQSFLAAHEKTLRREQAVRKAADFIEKRKIQEEEVRKKATDEPETTEVVVDKMKITSDDAVSVQTRRAGDKVEGTGISAEEDRIIKKPSRTADSTLRESKRVREVADSRDSSGNELRNARPQEYANDVFQKIRLIPAGEEVNVQMLYQWVVKMGINPNRNAIRQIMSIAENQGLIDAKVTGQEGRAVPRAKFYRS